MLQEPVNENFKRKKKTLNVERDREQRQTNGPAGDSERAFQKGNVLESMH